MNKENIDPSNDTSDVSNLPLKSIHTNTTQEIKKPSSSGNIDQHFQLIHETNSEIQQQLFRVETSTAQTNVDLEQLYVRSKSNNENLNKLLKNIVEYSNEVITEGNATKSDMSLIIKALEEIKSSHNGIKDSDLIKIKDEIHSFLEEREFNDMETKMEVEKLYNYIKDNEHKTSTHLQNELNNISKDKDHRLDDLVDQVTKLNRTIGLENSTKNIEQLLETLSMNFDNKLNSILKQQEALELQHKIDTLEQKYNLLTIRYNEKFNQFVNLQQKFETLSNQVKQTQLSTIPITQIDNLKKFHKTNLQMIDEKNIMVYEKQRIVSTPIKFSNNSDDENNNNDDNEL
ncbi:hypothetical protein KGF54_000339 [Candida jiufengensis]|uniref:uncharacterized protein n=1 Tax=Candida jiufengensis TaxID=497108 RepID=UPI0022242954|nr:uncharacterized protein KGF54_000339 [Candida jiufengensis]KAI5956722.1 hypothetical protein KGF54_000339 [Candida jiufengensis]